MAVEARHLSLFPPQFLHNREIMNAIDMSTNVYGVPATGYGVVVPPLSATTTETLIPMYGSDSIPANKTTATTNTCAPKADSGLTYALPATSRKRARDSVNLPAVGFPINQNYVNRCAGGGGFTFLGEDISLQIHQQQLEIDHFISQQTEKVRIEIEERRKRNSRQIIAAVEDGIVNKLRAKEEEIEKMGRLNNALEEKVKSLYVENQIWRDLAQTNEATANALRVNLEQVLTHLQQNDAVANKNSNGEDEESCCGSNYEERKGEGENGRSDRLCRSCGEGESCVLLLPCRHLCLCTVCGSSLLVCPVCKSTKNASVHVNMSTC